MKTLIVIAMLLLASSACTKSTSSWGVYENSTYDPGIYVDLDEWPKFQKTMPTETELNKMLRIVNALFSANRLAAIPPRDAEFPGSTPNTLHLYLTCSSPAQSPADYHTGMAFKVCARAF